jgi:MarR family transcriptional regulator, organic hydroperoxide resistance regulator
MSSMIDSKQENEAEERFEAAFDEFLLALRRSQARGRQAPDDLTLAQYYLLHPLEREDAVPLCQLADLAGIAAPTATRLVDGLEHAGVIRRQRSETDRRTVKVSLTDDGRRRLERKHEQLARRRHRVYENLEPGEREQSERLLRHLAELITEL